MMKKTFLILCVCVCACMPVFGQNAALGVPSPAADAPASAQPAVSGQDWFADFINRAFLVFLPKGDKVVVLADSDIDVWHGKWFFYADLAQGESFDLSDEDSKKVFVVREIGVNSVKIDYTAEIKTRYPASKTTVTGQFEANYSAAWKAIAYFGLENELRGIISSGFDVNSRDTFGRTPLMIAAFCGHEKLCKLLLRAGADVNAVQKDGLSAVMLACRHPGIVSLLLKSGADPDAVDNDGRNVLVYASCDAEAMKLLLEDGKAKVTGDAADRALMWVVRFGTTECLKLLVEKGANVNARVDRTSILRWAIKDRRDRAVGILVSAGAQQ